MTRLAALALLLVASGCSVFGAGRGGNPDLAAARARWSASGLRAYTMTQSRSCFCPRDATGPFRVAVRDGAVTQVTLDGKPVPTDRALTVEDLFDLLADAYARGADEVRVTYHASLGYPTELWVDYEQRIADEETGYAITALAPAR